MTNKTLNTNNSYYYVSKFTRKIELVKIVGVKEIPDPHSYISDTINTYVVENENGKLRYVTEDKLIPAVKGVK